ncbi:hypothetical protein DY000_02006293 [Brassica cretica]|uniref:Ubiquitin-like protease family profile domain-containing protein n=1 Tax=Brassica cretica TaxID=69181 RepID=A0ABQ7CIX4_BRACR|nr:hypothetical protein DY000_02006293 [Brassica cretica]
MTRPFFSRNQRRHPQRYEREKCFENEHHKTRSPPFDENIADEGMRIPNAAEDCLQPEKSGTAVTALTTYSNVLLVRPLSYVSQPKSNLTRRYRDEEAVPVAWEERNPNLYNSIKTVHASHHASSTYPDAEPNVASTGNKDVGEPVLVEENLEGVPSPVVEGGAREPPLSGGKRQRKKSNKIRGVYTPDARLKGLFSSEKKVEYEPTGKSSRAVFNRFRDFLSENLAQKFEIKTSIIVTNSFSLDIAEPGKWLSNEHMHVIMEIEDEDKLHFNWGKNIASYVPGKTKGKNLKLELGCDVDMVYAPMMWGADHWYVGHTVHHAKEGQLYYSWSRVDGIYNNGRTGDCGTCAAKFIQMNANCDGKEEMSLITDKIVDRFREKYAMDCYEEFVGYFRVANKG